MFDYRSHFERRKNVCGGALVIKGTRVSVKVLLASLAEGGSEAEILSDYPSVSPEALKAVIAFAADSAQDITPIPPVPLIG